MKMQQHTECIWISNMPVSNKLVILQFPLTATNSFYLEYIIILQSVLLLLYVNECEYSALYLSKKKNKGEIAITSNWNVTLTIMLMIWLITK